MKKVWDIISTVFVGVVVLITVAMMVFTIVSVNTFNRADRDIFGYKAFIVMSDSMSKTDFNAGDLVVIREVDPSTLQEGDIITFQSQNSHNYGENVTHKIRSRTTTVDGNPGFITYGTTTDTDDEAIVTYPYIQGQYQFAMPKVGLFFNFLRTPQGYFLFILIPFLVLVVHQGLNVIKAFRAYKAAQLAELRRQRARILAEKRKSEAMMRQLMQMQRQMQAQQAAPVQAPAPAPAPAPTPEKKHQDVDVESMMAELAALRAQLAEKNKTDA